MDGAGRSASRRVELGRSGSSRMSVYAPRRRSLRPSDARISPLPEIALLKGPAVPNYDHPSRQVGWGPRFAGLALRSCPEPLGQLGPFRHWADRNEPRCAKRERGYRLRSGGATMAARRRKSGLNRGASEALARRHASWGSTWAANPKISAAALNICTPVFG